MQCLLSGVISIKLDVFSNEEVQGFVWSVIDCQAMK